jgi:hypothetical protein
MSGLPPYYPDDPNFQQEWDDETNQGSWLCHVSIFLVVLIDWKKIEMIMKMTRPFIIVWTLQQGWIHK